MAITYIAAAEQIVGEGNPSFEDTKNRAGKYIDAQMLVEHLSTGVHKERATLLTGEQYTFTGNGAARTIALQNTKLTPLLVECWEIADTSTEIVVNGNFDSDAANWTAFDSTIASVAGGQSGNCLEITKTGGTQQIAQSDAMTFLGGRTYTITGYVKSGTSGNEAYSISLGGQATASGTSSGSWVQFTGTFYNLIGNTLSAQISLIKNTDTAGTMLFDQISIKEATAHVSLWMSPFPVGTAGRRDDTLLSNGGITGVSVGAIKIASDLVNHNTLTNYYYVLGVDVSTVPSGDAGAGADPTWITSDVANLMYGDGTGGSSSNWANSVEGEIETAFLHEHNDNGTHTAPIWAGYGQVETYTYVGDGTNARTVTLQDTSLVIKELFLLRSFSADAVVSVNASMTTYSAKYETTAAFLTSAIVSIGTGSFVINASVNVAGVQYYYYAAGE